MKREAKIGIFAVAMLIAAWAGIRYWRLTVSCSTTLSLRPGSNEMPVTVPIFTPFIMIGEAVCTPLIWS